MTDATDEASDQTAASRSADDDIRDDADDPSPPSPTTAEGHWPRILRSPAILGILALLAGMAAIMAAQTVLSRSRATTPLLSAPVELVPGDLRRPAGPGVDNDRVGNAAGPTATTAESASDGLEPVPGPGPPSTWRTETVDGGSSGSTGQPTTTTAPTPSPPSTDDPEVVSARVERFRSLAAEANMTSELVTDDEIARFGRTLCIVAAVIDGDDYAGFRSEVADDYNGQDDSRLSADELRRAVDTAIEAFCPDQANRLGLA